MPTKPPCVRVQLRARCHHDGDSRQEKIVNEVPPAHFRHFQVSDDEGRGWPVRGEVVERTPTVLGFHDLVAFADKSLAHARAHVLTVINHQNELLHE